MIKKVLQYQQRLTGEPFFGTVRRYLIFVTGGLACWFMLIAIHSFFRDVYSLNPAISYAVGLAFAAIFTFAYHRFVTFRIKTKWKTRFIQFSVVVVLFSFCNWALFYLGRVVFDLPIPDYVMSFFITGFISVINFGINRIIIFRHQ